MLGVSMLLALLLPVPSPDMGDFFLYQLFFSVFVCLFLMKLSFSFTGHLEHDLIERSIFH